MKYVTSFIGAAALAVASYSVNASPVTAGGVTWDPISNGGIAGSFNFQQWYADPSSYVTDVNGVTKLADGNAVDPQSAIGLLSGVGLFDQIFDSRTLFGNIGFPGQSNYCSNCILTFSFGGLAISNISGNSVTFDTSNSWLNVYFQSPILVPAVTSLSYQNVNGFQSGDLWASFKFDSFWLDGSLLGGFVQSTLSVTGGLPDVVAALDRNSGVSDLTLTGSAYFDGLYTDLSNGQFASIPEPASIALLGLGLLGLVGGRRFKKA